MYLTVPHLYAYGSQGKGILIDDPVRCRVFPYRMLTGITQQHERREPSRMQLGAIVRGPIQLPRDEVCNIFDITGRQIHTIDPAPGIYFIKVDSEMIHKVIKIK
jgi:hypothetical protein